MLEFRFHGRGGQGAVIAANLLGNAAFTEGKFALSSPKFGVERRGAPVTAFLRINDRAITSRYEIRDPDCVVVLDETLATTVNVTQGLKKGGWIIINSAKEPEVFARAFAHLGNFKIATVPATEIAIQHGIGSKTNPIVNTTILGAMIKVLSIVKMETLIDIITQEIPKPESNIEAAREAFEKVGIAVISRVSQKQKASQKIPKRKSRAKKTGLEGRVSITTLDTLENKTGSWRTMRPVVNCDKCKASGKKCSFCWVYCPDNAIKIAGDGTVSVNYDYCKGCGICAQECPRKAIDMQEEKNGN